MPDTKISDLPRATYLDDDSLLVAEQLDDAVAVDGALFKAFAREATKELADSASAAAVSANGAKVAAQSALAGVQAALNNLPAGDTLIVNDLTTGGTSAALSAEMGKTLAQRPNPNLLHNWYFANAVNQRGAAEYTSTTAWVYAVDRWKMTNATLTKKDGCWNFVAPSDATAYKRIMQLTEHTLKAGVTYTISMLAQINNVGPMVAFRPCTNTGSAITTVTGGSGLQISEVTTAPKVFVYTFTPTVDVVNAGVEILMANLDGYYLDADIYAIKLELGSVQTLAHQNADGNWVLNEIPDYGEELRKCQRYFYRLKNDVSAPMYFNTAAKCLSANALTTVVDLPVPMRITPEVTPSSADALIHNDGTKVASTSVTRNGVIAGNQKVGITLGGAFTVGTVYMIYIAGGAYIDFDANL